MRRLARSARSTLKRGASVIRWRLIRLRRSLALLVRGMRPLVAVEVFEARRFSRRYDGRRRPPRAFRAARRIGLHLLRDLILDIGANVGHFAQAVLDIAPKRSRSRRRPSTSSYGTSG